jgi:hypothetical protein
MFLAVLLEEAVVIGIGTMAVITSMITMWE